mgnify:CR=1 FL=1
MTAKEILQDLISTIEKNSTDNKATITNVDLWVKSWRKELNKVNNVVLDGVSVSLPSVDDIGIIAVEIAEINNEMTAQEQAFFIAGFSEYIKYLEMQSNER